MIPHRYRLQYGGIPTVTAEKISAFGKRSPATRNRELALKLLEMRRRARENDESVDTVMNRGDDTTRFHYFGEGEP